MALTFDDGPDPSGTPDVLRALDAIGARATFFVLGSRALRHPRLVRDVVAAGHELGLHGFDHVRHSRRSRAAVERDTEAALAALAGLGVAPRRWRTPWGDVAPWTAEVASARGLALTGWSADTVDWRGDAAERMLEAVAPALAPGCVVLMHDGLGPGARRRDCAETARLLRPLADAIADRGCTIGPLPALAVAA